MKRSLAKLFQTGGQQQSSCTSYEGVVCDSDSASIASQDVFKVKLPVAVIGGRLGIKENPCARVFCKRTSLESA